MNIVELNKLTNSKLSHLSRSLYTFYLRPLAEQNQCIIDLVSVANYLFSDSIYFKTLPNFEVAAMALNELEEIGLINRVVDGVEIKQNPLDKLKASSSDEVLSNQDVAIEDHDSKLVSSQEKWQGVTFTLPLFVKESQELPKPPFAMTLSWRPQARFHEACLLCGLEDCTFEEKELKAFTSYWAGRHETRNQIAWERAFAQRLLKGRVAKTNKVKAPTINALGEISENSSLNSVTANSNLNTENEHQELTNPADFIPKSNPTQSSLMTNLQKSEHEQMSNTLADLFK